MKIYISKGNGRGPTTKAAFDEALFQAGIADFNIIYLSSIIPPNTEIIEQKFPAEQVTYGDRLYAVVAQELVDTPDEEAWAGIAWSQAQTSDKRGLFVEAHGFSKRTVQENLESTMQDLIAKRKQKHNKINYAITGLKCDGEPVCALVAACFQAHGWR